MSGKSGRIVKEGDTFTVNGVTYQFGSGSAASYNLWLEFVAQGHRPSGAANQIHVYIQNQPDGDFFTGEEIQKALEAQSH